MAKISLCIIAGNEENYIVRFLDSFKNAFDELCIVRAVGNQAHDKTVALAKEWCGKNRKECKIGEYRNRSVWYRLGQAQNRVYDIRVSDDTQRTIIDVVLEGEGGDI